MSKRLIIHDFKQEDEFMKRNPDTDLVFRAAPRVQNCIGCYGCWLETPGKCVIADRCQKIPSMLAVCQELVIVSRLLYGGYSPEVKAVLDRSIGYIMPFFRVVGGEMHHVMRYDNPFKLDVHFYSQTNDETEYELARKLVFANAVNLGAGSNQVHFHKTTSLVKEAIR